VRWAADLQLGVVELQAKIVYRPGNIDLRSQYASLLLTRVATVVTVLSFISLVVYKHGHKLRERSKIAQSFSSVFRGAPKARKQASN